MITPRRRKRDSFLPWVQLAVDVAATAAILKLVFWFRFDSGYFSKGIADPYYGVYYRSFMVVTLTVIFFLRQYKLYQPAKIYTFGDEAGRVFRSIGAAAVVLTALTFFIRDISFSRSFLLLSLPVLAVALSVARTFLGLIVMQIDKARGSYRNLLVIGCDDNARKLVRFYRRNPRFSTRVTGFLDDTLPKGETVEGVPVLGRIDELGYFVKFQRDIHEAVLSAPVQRDEILKMIYECEKEMVSFRWIADIFALIASRMSVSNLGGVSLLSFTDSPLVEWENRALKRAMDVLLSSAGMVILSPVFLAIALFVKSNSKGPVFYRQQRIGENGKHFMLLKFRTMKPEAESQTGPVWTQENDPRRTGIGAFLRKTNIDELPQLWNVFKGDMSLVGPRPERPFFVSQFREDIPRYMARHSIRSGMTGWAQVNGLRGNTSIEERTKFDLYYIENWSIWFDVRILFMTFLKNRNAY